MTETREMVTAAGAAVTMKHFIAAVAAQFQKMAETGLFRVAVDSEELWKTYLASFPEGTNQIYKKRTEHDCSACRSFVKAVGGVVTIRDGAVGTIWDVGVEGEYAVVAEAMRRAVRRAVEDKGIENVFLS